MIRACRLQAAKPWRRQNLFPPSSFTPLGRSGQGERDPKIKGRLWRPFIFVAVHRFFCPCALLYIARKGMYARETLVGFPLHVKLPARRRPLLRSKSAALKRKHHPDGWCFLFGAGYGNRTRLLGLGSRCTTDVLTLHRDSYYSREFRPMQPKIAVRHDFSFGRIG